MKLKSKFYVALFAPMMFACGGDAEGDSSTTESGQETETTEATIEYGPLLSTTEVSESDRIETADALAGIEDKSTVIRYVSSEYNQPFPDALLEAYNLQVMSLSVAGELPENMGDFQNLTTLVLGGSFTTLPESVGTLENLKVVSFEYCKDLDIEQAMGVLANCPNIEYMSLASMGMDALPASIGDLSNLKHLRLSGNPLTTIPESFYGLSKLEHLRLGSNEGMDYEAVLASAKAFPNLSTLWLQYCGFESLPAVLGEYPALTKVNWREQWDDKSGDEIIATTDKEGEKFPNFDVSWNSMSGMMYDIY